MSYLRRQQIRCLRWSWPRPMHIPRGRAFWPGSGSGDDLLEVRGVIAGNDVVTIVACDKMDPLSQAGRFDATASDLQSVWEVEEGGP